MTASDARNLTRTAVANGPDPDLVRKALEQTREKIARAAGYGDSSVEIQLPELVAGFRESVLAGLRKDGFLVYRQTAASAETYVVTW